jgi:Holliday junction resolvase
VRTHLPPKTQATRIENRHGGGVPDLFLQMDGVGLWVELKVEKSSRVLLTPNQVAWHLRHAACGGRSYVMCRCPASPKVVIVPGSSAALVASEGLSPCVPVIATDDVAEALRALRLDALRPPVP